MEVDRLQIHPFKGTSLDGVLDFCAQNPVRPFYPRALLKRFITQLTSSNTLIFDIDRGTTRVAVTVLLDKVDNPSGSANLEIIGWSNAVPADELFAFVFLNLPTGRVVQAATHEAARPSSELLEQFGFRFLYHTFEMTKVDVNIPMSQANLETSIPPLAEMKETFSHRLKSKPTGTILLILNGKIVGFCSAVPDETRAKTGEVHMIGILPEVRGKGLGAIALSKAIAELSHLGCERCYLTVAAQNQSALYLYEKFGFKVEQTYTSY